MSRPILSLFALIAALLLPEISAEESACNCDPIPAPEVVNCSDAVLDDFSYKPEGNDVFNTMTLIWTEGEMFDYWYGPPAWLYDEYKDHFTQVTGLSSDEIEVSFLTPYHCKIVSKSDFADALQESMFSLVEFGEVPTEWGDSVAVTSCESQANSDAEYDEFVAMYDELDPYMHSKCGIGERWLQGKATRYPHQGKCMQQQLNKDNKDQGKDRRQYNSWKRCEDRAVWKTMKTGRKFECRRPEVPFTCQPGWELVGDMCLVHAMPGHKVKHHQAKMICESMIRKRVKDPPVSHLPICPSQEHWETILEWKDGSVERKRRRREADCTCPEPEPEPDADTKDSTEDAQAEPEPDTDTKDSTEEGQPEPEPEPDTDEDEKTNEDDTDEDEKTTEDDTDEDDGSSSSSEKDTEEDRESSWEEREEDPTLFQNTKRGEPATPPSKIQKDKKKQEVQDFWLGTELPKKGEAQGCNGDENYQVCKKGATEVKTYEWQNYKSLEFDALCLFDTDPFDFGEVKSSVVAREHVDASTGRRKKRDDTEVFYLDDTSYADLAEYFCQEFAPEVASLKDQR